MSVKRLFLSRYLHSLKDLCRGMSSKVMDQKDVHRVAQEGFKQGDHYDKNRPSYTGGIISHVIKKLHRGDQKDVRYDILELGAGTGIFTRNILGQLKDQPKTSYLATEPSEEFLDILRQQSPEVETLVCSAVQIPLPENSVQNVICAQSFHWFATEESVKEIHRVMVPGGRLILVWNDKDWTIEWLKKMEEVLTLYYGDTPRKMSGKWKNVFDSCQSFQQVEHQHIKGASSMKGDKDFVLNHFTSISVIAQLDPKTKEEAIAKFRAVLDKSFNDDEEINICLDSEFFCTEKVAA